MRKGFAVFTPMVGVLVIAITMLIVTSIITSERIAVQGSVKSYRSSELVNIAGEAQSRVIEEVRASITSRLEDYSIQGEPVMSIVVNTCPEPGIGQEFYETPECSGGKCVCGIDFGGGIDHCSGGEETCWGNAFHQVNLTASNELVAKALLESSIQHTIAGIVNKYSLVNITAKDIDFTGIIKKIGFKNCDWDDCGDGRIEVTIDFTPLSETPIAEISSEGKRLQVFMPAEERVYNTHEPFMQYAVLTSNLFNQFQLLNNSWHGAGGIPHGSSTDYSKTNGSEWQHYTYAIHERYYGSTGINSAASGWAPGFKTNVLNTEFAAEETLSDYMADKINTASASASIPAYKKSQELRFDTEFNTGWKEDLTQFTSGYSAFGTGAGMAKLQLSPTEEFADLPEQKLTIFPGGCIVPSTGGLCERQGIDTCLARDDVFGLAVPYDKETEGYTGTVLVNTSGDYDERFITSDDDEGMKKLVDKMRDDMRSEIVVGMGVPKNQLNYRLNVTSRQFYVEGSGFTGKDNWHCGQFLSLYQVAPPMSSDEIGTADSACEATRTKSSFTSEPAAFTGASGETKCVAGDCNTECTGGANSNCPWFVSEPIDWTCDSKTLYRVEEIYRLYRSTSDGEEPTRPVFAAKYVRVKDDYMEINEGRNNYTLWPSYGRYSDMPPGASDGIEESWEYKVANVRKCSYSYDTLSQEISRECEWVSSDKL